MNANNDEKIYYTYDRPNGEQIRIVEQTYKDKSYIHFRIYWLNKENEYAPTKRGIAIPKDELDNLKNAINKIS